MQTPASQVRLFRNGRDQAVRIPVEFELPGDTAVMHREGNRLVIEPIHKMGVTLATHNVGEFRRVRGLKLENSLE